MYYRVLRGVGEVHHHDCGGGFVGLMNNKTYAIVQFKYNKYSIYDLVRL